MRIAWFTPFAKTSAIGKISALICEELAAEHQVDIWAPGKDDQIETNLPVKRFSADLKPDMLLEYDFVVYDLGNFAGFHRDIYDVSQKVPGIVILHDQTMASFWGQYYCIQEFGGDGEHGVEQYRRMVREYYGEGAALAVDEAVRSGLYPFYAHTSLEGYSFLEPTVQNAKGIFTHAGFFCEKLRDITNTPMDFSYLPCSVPEQEEKNVPKELADILKRAREEGRKVILSTGIVHPVKRIDKVVQVLRESPVLAEKICYIVVGGYGGEYGDTLKELSEKELKGCLHMMGYQPDEVMEAALQQTDLSINLRYPNSEVCSLSLWEQMAYGKPVLVLDSGVYGEVPEDAVIRISRRQETEKIKQTLQSLVEDTIDLSIGERAREFIRTRCNVSEYCKRLLAFAKRLEDEYAVAQLQKRVVEDVGRKMAALGMTEEWVPASYSKVIDQLSGIFGSEKPKVRRKTMGIWIGFPYHVPNLSREGISRLMGYLVSSMLQTYPEVEAEIWSYSFNEEECRKTFESVRPEDRGRIRYLTEKNWAAELEASPAQKIEAGEINEQKDNLVCAARVASKASVFIPLILYLDRIAEVERRLFVPGYDMAVAEHYGDFIAKDPLYIARNLDYIWRAENFAARGADFFSNSDTVRLTEIIRYIPNLSEACTHVVYIPPNIPDYGVDDVMSRDELKEKFALEGRYLFYPTQIRPYKNVSTLVCAFARLQKDNPDLKLVLTGTPEDVPEVAELIKTNNIASRLVLLKNVSERELYSLYFHAAAIPVASVFEGGFHYQAMEAFLMQAPPVVAAIPVVQERIQSLGFTEDNCGFLLFDPLNDEDLAEKLQKVLDNRAEAVQAQSQFAKKLMSYTWKKTIPQYYKLFFES